MRDLDATPPEQLVARGEAFVEALRRSGQDRLLATFEAVQKELAQASSAQRQAATEVQDAVLLRDAADDRLDAVVADLSLAALETSGGDPGDPIFHSIFPDGPQVFTTVPIEEEVRLVGGLVAKLAGHPLEGRFRRKIEIELEGVEQAERRLSHALTQEAATYATLRRATVSWLLQARVAEAAAEGGTPPRDSTPPGRK
jgi:hypothetical protein